MRPANEARSSKSGSGSVSRILYRRKASRRSCSLAGVGAFIESPDSDRIVWGIRDIVPLLQRAYPERWNGFPNGLQVENDRSTMSGVGHSSEPLLTDLIPRLPVFKPQIDARQTAHVIPFAGPPSAPLAMLAWLGDRPQRPQCLP